MVYFIALFPALAIAAVGMLLRQRSPRAGRALIVLGCIGCLAVMGWQVRQTLFQPDARPPDRSHSIVSYYLANQAMRDTAGRSGVVLLLFPPRPVADTGTATDYANAFEPILTRGHPELKVESITLDTPVQARPIPAAVFKQALAKYPNALAYVSYAGVPADMDQLFSPDRPAPPFYAFDPCRGTHWLAALKRGRVRSVIVPRPDVDLGKRTGIVGDPVDIFNRLYLMVSLENADEIAARFGKSR